MAAFKVGDSVIMTREKGVVKEGYEIKCFWDAKKVRELK